MDRFEAQINNFTDKSEELLMDIVRQSIQEVTIEAQKTKAKGGKMPVDTGFLRASGLAALNQMPRGEIIGRERKEGETGVLPEYQAEENGLFGSSLPVTLAKMKKGDTFFWGWTAIYANRQNIYNGFLDSAIIKWPEVVNNVTKRLRK